MDFASAPIVWVVLFIVAVTIFGLVQSLANLRASRRKNQMEDLAEEVAHLRDEVAQLRDLVERVNGAVGETVDSIKVKPF